MQVNSVVYIELIFKNDSTYKLDVLQTLTTYTLRVSLRFSIECNGKPIAFIWHNSDKRPITPKLIKWIEEEFKPLFDYDGFKWMASVGTCCPELRPYLIPFHKEL